MTYEGVDTAGCSSNNVKEKETTMTDKIIDRLVSIKSIVTLTLTVVFSVLALRNVISGDQFLTVFTVIIGFYFGTQAEKRAQEASDGH